MTEFYICVCVNVFLKQEYMYEMLTCFGNKSWLCYVGVYECMWERNVYDYGAVHLNNLQHSGDVCTSMFQLTDWEN